MAVLLGISAFVISLLLARRLLDPGSVLHLLDHPNERSLHQVPIPRSGGLAILAALYLTIAILCFSNDATVLLRIAGSVTLVAVVSLFDDHSHVAPPIRAAVHVAAALGLLIGGLTPDVLTLPGVSWAWPEIMAIPIASVFVVWMINLYNFMDGMDGFAGGMAVIGFGFFALMGWQAGSSPFTTLSLGAAAAAGGFLLFNFPPARIFLGDTGSSVLGLLASALTLWADRDGIFAWWIGVLVFSPFIVDATVTLIRRFLFERDQWLQAHKTHFYQRLVQLGWGHRKTVISEYLLMLACALSGAVAVRLGPVGQWLLIFAWIVGYAALIAAVTRLERKQGAAAG